MSWQIGSTLLCETLGKHCFLLPDVNSTEHVGDLGGQSETPWAAPGISLIPPLLSLLFIITSPTLSPSPSPCRYLSPWFKTEYYVTKWLEDVNKNTQGPFLRYFNQIML